MFLQNISLFGLHGKLRCTLAKDYATLYLMISSKSFFGNVLTLWDTIRKDTFVSFSQKYSFGANGQLKVSPNSVKGKGEILQVRGMGIFAGSNFFIKWEESEKERF